MLKKNNRGFSLIELIVTIGIVGILVMLGTPKFLGYVEKAELARIQYDIKVMEGKMAEDMIGGYKEFNEWDKNVKDLGMLILADKLFESEGIVKSISIPKTNPKYGSIASGRTVFSLENGDDDSDYRIIPTKLNIKIKSKLPGTFYTNADGKVYYEHDKPLTRAKEYQRIACESALPDYTFEHETGTIVKYHGDAQHLIIPPAFNVDGRCYPVLIIGKGAFMQGGYKTVIIPNTVVRIEEDAFKDNELKEVIILPSVKKIEGGAFSDNNINFGGGAGGSEGNNGEGGGVGGPGGGEGGSGNNGETGNSSSRPGSGGVFISNSSRNIIISGGAFTGNGRDGATTITPEFRPSTDKSLGVKFDKESGTITKYDGKEREIAIPEIIMVGGEEISIKTIEKGAYQGKGLISVILPEGLERIEDYAFSGNQLVGVIIPNSVNHIGNYAFAFNEVEKTGNVAGPLRKATIKTIIMKNKEQFNKVNKYGNILENDEKIDQIDGMKLLEYIFVTSVGNFIVDVGDNLEDESAGFPEDELDDYIAEKDYIPIATPEDLDAIRNNALHVFAKGTKWQKEYYGGLENKYIQVKDIDMKKVKDFEPIASFKGMYDGGNFIIRNLKINRPNQDYVGLFSRVVGGVRENISLINVNIEGRNNVGGLVGSNYGSVIKNSYVTGSVKGINYVGGLAGENEYNSTINNSYAVVDILGIDYVGGLTGLNNSRSTVSNSYTTGDVMSIGNYVGGLVALNNATIYNSYATGNVFGEDTVGGLVGRNERSISNSYAIGKVVGNKNIGGLIGWRFPINTSVKNSFYNSETAEINMSAGGIAKTTKEMQTLSTYAGWDFTVWEMKDGEYPLIK